MPRKQKTIHYLYKTICVITGKYYIGMHSTNNLNDGYMGSGKRLRYSIRKYGVENHVKEILEFFNTGEELAKNEKEIVTLNEIEKEKCLNLKVGGEGGGTNNGEYGDKCYYVNNVYWKNAENRNRLNLLVSNALKKKWLDPEYRAKMLIVAKKGKGRILSDDIKKKRKGHKRQVGELNSQFGTCWVTKNGENKKIKKDLIQQYVSDGWSLGSTINHDKRISNDKITEIKSLYNELKSCIKVAKELNIAKSTVLKYLK